MKPTNKQFLPSNNNRVYRSTIEPMFPLIENGGRTSSPTRKRPSCGDCLRRFVPVISACSLVSALTFIGAALTIVPDGHVGYYVPNDTCLVDSTCELRLFRPDYYFIPPWTGGGPLAIANIGERNLTLGVISVSGNASTEQLFCTVRYAITDVNVYVKTLVVFGEERAFVGALVEELKRGDDDIVSYANSRADDLPIAFDAYGISITRVTCRPVILSKVVDGLTTTSAGSVRR